MNLGHIVADAWQQALEETPDPLSGGSWLMAALTGAPYSSYRHRLDAPKRNYRGAVIPTRVLVARNLRQLGPTRLNPGRLR